MAFKKREDSNMSVDCVLKKSFWNFNYPSKVSQVQYDALFGLNFLMDLKFEFEQNEQGESEENLRKRSQERERES